MNWDLLIYSLVLFVVPGIIIVLMYLSWNTNSDEAEFNDSDEVKREIKQD